MPNPVPLALTGKGHLCMRDSVACPYSVKEAEFDFLTLAVFNNKLKRGFELATAFGISLLGPACAFRHTMGHLVSMDAYVEETLHSPLRYRNITPEDKQAVMTLAKTSSGYKSARYLVDAFGLSETVSLEIGWSPTDVSSIILKHNPPKQQKFYCESRVECVII